MRCRASGWPDSPHPFTAADGAAGHRHDLSILQAEFSLTQILDKDLGSDLPRAGHPRQPRHRPPRSGRSRLRPPSDPPRPSRDTGTDPDQGDHRRGHPEPARGRQTHPDQAVREGPAHRDHHHRHQRFRDRETTDESARAAGDRRHRQPAPARRPTNRPRPDHRGPIPCTPSSHPSPPRPAPASQACAWVSSAAMPCSPRCRCVGSNPTASPTKISAH
jgi:hypothetical protein